MIKALFLCIALLIFTYKFGYAYNISTSLPYKHFIIVKRAKIFLGDYVLFTAPEASVYHGFELIKQAKGGPGDKVTLNNNAVYINNQYMGEAKQESLSGEALEVINELTIPENKFYVSGASVDSFDSRYRNFGLIDANNIIGIAIPVW